MHLEDKNYLVNSINIFLLQFYLFVTVYLICHCIGPILIVLITIFFSLAEYSILFRHALPIQGNSEGGVGWNRKERIAYFLSIYLMV